MADGEYIGSAWLTQEQSGRRRNTPLRLARSIRISDIRSGYASNSTEYDAGSKISDIDCTPGRQPPPRGI